MATWRESLARARAHSADDSPIVAVAPTDAVLDIDFDAGYGAAEGPDVLIWSEDRVYFPITYDGAEWLGSAPRHPQLEGQGHIGGE